MSFVSREALHRAIDAELNRQGFKDRLLDFSTLNVEITIRDGKIVTTVGYRATTIASEMYE